MKLPAASLLAFVNITLGTGLFVQAGGGPVKVTIQPEKSHVSDVATLPVDPAPKVRYGMQIGVMMPGLAGINGERLTYSPEGGHQMVFHIDGTLQFAGQGNCKLVTTKEPLNKVQGGKRSLGVRSEWVAPNKLHFTQIVDIIPSKTPAKGIAGGKRHLDVMLVRFIVENKDNVNHTVGIRNTMDVLLIDNDSALFASPTTHPGQIMNGHEFKGDKVPEYLQILQRPNVKDPGYVTHFTLKVGKLEPPTRFICTHLGAVGTPWDVPAQQAGDSAVAIFFDPKAIPPGGKRDMAWAYGIGIAANPENEGRVSMHLAGSFDPGKQFTVTAYVDDPLESQALTLELPPGLERVEGKAMQAVPPPQDNGQSIVVWKVRVDKLGSFPLKVRSSNGMVYNAMLKIEPAEKGEVVRIGAMKDVVLPTLKKTEKGVEKAFVLTEKKKEDRQTSAAQSELKQMMEVQNRLIKKIADLEGDLADAVKKFGPNSPQAQDLENQRKTLSRANAEIANTLQSIKAALREMAIGAKGEQE